MRFSDDVWEDDCIELHRDIYPGRLMFSNTEMVSKSKMGFFKKKILSADGYE